MRRIGPPPEQLYFKIGEVARIVGVEPHVLRHWEKAFSPLLKPQKTAGGHRRYRRRDIEMAVRIRRLLYDEKMTVEGARRRLFGRRAAASDREEAVGARREARLRTDLAVLRRELIWLLDRVEHADEVPVEPRLVADEGGVRMELRVVERDVSTPDDLRASWPSRE